MLKSEQDIINLVNFARKLCTRGDYKQALQQYAEAGDLLQVMQSSSPSSSSGEEVSLEMAKKLKLAMSEEIQLVQSLLKELEQFPNFCNEQASTKSQPLIKTQQQQRPPLTKTKGSYASGNKQIVSGRDLATRSRPPGKSSHPRSAVTAPTASSLAKRANSSTAAAARLSQNNSNDVRGVNSKAAPMKISATKSKKTHRQHSQQPSIINDTYREIDCYNAEFDNSQNDEDDCNLQNPHEEEPVKIFNSLGYDNEMVDTMHREILNAKPNVKWSDIAGLEQAKKLLEEAVVIPMLLPDYFQGIRRPWRGVLMYGAAGTGKTILAKALATECQSTFFNVTATALTSKWRGDSEKMVRLLFEMARFYAPSVIFIDEVDSLTSSRDTDGEHEASRRVKSEILVQMDGMASCVPDKQTKSTNDDDDDNGKDGQSEMKQVMVLGATNHPWKVDDAIRRRFEKRVYIPLPGKETITELLKINLKDVKISDDVDLQQLAEKLDGYSGADITNVCRDAAMMPMRRAIEGLSTDQIKQLDKATIKECAVLKSDFESSIGKIQPSVSSKDVTRYEEWAAEFGSC
ncbi:hypothetical protein MIR68_011607 [Amoeboaphelidium protococcarum]|nr:hypothetical protein MIR68_011607 [Amoeboaphelidium protococcarum]